MLVLNVLMSVCIKYEIKKYALVEHSKFNGSKFPFTPVTSATCVTSATVNPAYSTISIW